MIFKREGDRVILEMTADQYNSLLMLIGMAMGALLNEQQEKDEFAQHAFYAALEFTNEMNAQNPQFTQYEIPEEYRGSSSRLVEMIKRYSLKVVI